MADNLVRDVAHELKRYVDLQRREGGWEPSTTGQAPRKVSAGSTECAMPITKRALLLSACSEIPVSSHTCNATAVFATSENTTRVS